MGVYLRFFSTSPEPLSLDALSQHLREVGSPVTLDTGGGEPAGRLGTLTVDGSPLAQLEVNVGDELVREELEDLLEMLGRAWGPRARRIRAALESTKQIVAAQVLHGGRSEAGWNQLSPAVEWLVTSTGPIWQADEAGYYEGQRLILRQR